MNASAMASGVCIVDHPSVPGDVVEKAEHVMPTHRRHTFGCHCAREPKPIYCGPKLANRFAKKLDAQSASAEIPRRTSMRMGHDFRLGDLGPSQHQNHNHQHPHTTA